jgi:succinoglycan biosynthesis transport protein ExoP
MNRMSGTPTPLPSTALTPVQQPGEIATPGQQWGPPIGGAPGEDAGERKTPWHRYGAALVRFKWLIAGCLVAGMGAGVFIVRRTVAEYEAHTTIWIATEERGQSGPISVGEPIETTAWVDLFRSYRVVQPIVVKLGLYLHFRPADAALFKDFALNDQYQPGDFVLLVDATGRNYRLTTKKGTGLEHGVAGDSIGRALGFRWQPPRSAFRPGRVAFSVTSLADADQALLDRANPVLPDQSNFLRVTLTSWSPEESAETLNLWADEFIDVAKQLKQYKIVEVRSTVGQQLTIAQTRLQQAEQKLQDFEAANIRATASATGPVSSAPATPGAPGAAPSAVTDPAIGAYLALKVQHDNLSQDIASAQAILADFRAGKATPDALLGIGSLMLGADALRAAIAQHTLREQHLTELRRTYTDEYKDVQDTLRALTVLDQQTIPQLATQAIRRLQSADDISTRQLTQSEHVVEGVPSRTIDLMRLQREVQSASELYTGLQKSFEDARMAEASAIPDVRILDRAEPPQRPTQNTAPRVLMMTVFGGLGVGLVLALILDRLDYRFRYPEQATDELGLPIIGTVPGLPSARQRQADPEVGSQVVEAFRTIRMHVQELFPAGEPVMFTVTSPGAGEGKSLISSNLAMSFAESGRRTLLIDGDIRRGQLHATFNLRQSPGLLDYLLGHAALDEVLQETDYDRLTLLTCGTRRHRGPELLQSEGLAQLLAAARPLFDVILVDSPPLGAGIDPFALAKVTGSMMLVLRVGRSDRNMAQAKLAAMDRYTRARQMGAVLNDVKMAGAYRYYSYLYGYRLDEGELRAQIPSRVGALRE